MWASLGLAVSAYNRLHNTNRGGYFSTVFFASFFFFGRIKGQKLPVAIDHRIIQEWADVLGAVRQATKRAERTGRIMDASLISFCMSRRKAFNIAGSRFLSANFFSTLRFKFQWASRPSTDESPGRPQSSVFSFPLSHGCPYRRFIHLGMNGMSRLPVPGLSQKKGLLSTQPSAGVSCQPTTLFVAGKICTKTAKTT